ncbi:MAG: hypothetical protein HXX13_00610 [Bacteroidetes bacterium]|nr:hypothetical protein [Bacteroidota bacterium]
MNLFQLLYPQVLTNLKPGSSVPSVKDSTISVTRPDSDRDDLPFLDYKPVLIWTSPTDTVSDYGYIKRNFTDQMLSVWNHPRRLYPASRIYALSLDGNYYRSCNVSPRNYVFLQRMVKGNMNLYMYRKIPQTNGWVEFISSDGINPGYRNFMIVEEKGRRGSWNQFGYYITTEADSSSFIMVQQGSIKSFAKDYLSETPSSKAMALKFGKKNYNQLSKILVATLMTAGMTGAILGKDKYRWIFMMGFPLGLGVAILNRPHSLHWEDMVKIVEMHNRELAGAK